MNPFPIGNNNNPPLNNVNSSLANVDNSHPGDIPFGNTVKPDGPHTLASTGSNIQSAAGIYPCAQTGGKINRRKINKISRKYKMKGSKRTIKKRVKRIKSRIRSKYSRTHSNHRTTKRHHSKRGGNKKHVLKGGSAPMSTPNYPAGYSQFNNNNGSLSNTYSTGGVLKANESALANPVPFNKLPGGVDNLNHATKNAYGTEGAGSGFPSRGWF